MMKSILVLFFIFLSGLANAHEEPLHYDRIQLSATANGHIDNDTAVATLYSQHEGSNASALAKRVNENIQWAIKIVEKQKQIKVQTSSYSSSPVYRDNKISGWRVRQTLRLETRNIAELSELLGKLQEKTLLQGIQFTVSPENKNRLDDELISEAIAAFEARAEAVANQLQRDGYKIVDMNISTSGVPMRPQRFEMQAMSSRVMDSAPAVSAGEQKVQVVVNGSIELQ